MRPSLSFDTYGVPKPDLGKKLHLILLDGMPFAYDAGNGVTNPSSKLGIIDVLVHITFTRAGLE